MERGPSLSRMTLRKLWLPCALLLAGCAGDILTPEVCETQSCFEARYFHALGDGATDCVVPPSELDRTLDLALYRDRGVTDAQLAEVASRGQRYFASYRLRLVTGGPPREGGLRHAMAGSAAEIDAALDAAGVPRDRP